MKSKAFLDIKSIVNESISNVNLEGSRLLVAVSGGQDSLALLHVLYSLKKQLSINLVVAHLNHNLRGRESELDSEFVSKLSNELRIPCVLGTADVQSIKDNKKLSLEEAAREARYTFLANTLVEKGADAVVMGHTSTDQSETILFNALRGSGLKGISGMSEMSSQLTDGIRVPIFRPFLQITRNQTLQYCLNNDLQPRHDSSNDLESFTRNRIRKQLIPALKEYNVNIEDSLIRLASNAAEANDFIHSCANKILSQYVNFYEEKIVINNDVIELHRALRSSLIMQALENLNYGLKNIRQIHVREIINLMKGSTGKVINLPNGIEAHSFNNTTILSFKQNKSAISIGGEHIIKIPGITNIPGWRINSSFEQTLVSDFANKDQTIVNVDKRLASNPVWVRGWQNGDRMQPLGMLGTKKVQDIFVDHKVPKIRRKSLPVICSDRGIIWIAGCGISDWAKVTNMGDSALKLAAIEISSK
ncbi:MAG: tRNA lysidine(34) synthetase TilS [Dehalococcoidia bacterium]|nr:tRNA lysidine(34) synthetase TilS [Dehalococcoidia bacterium]